jgi:predicted oxidoreductase
MQAIPGTTKYSRIADMVKGVDVELSKPEWYEIYSAAGNRLP